MLRLVKLLGSNPTIYPAILLPRLPSLPGYRHPPPHFLLVHCSLLHTNSPTRFRARTAESRCCVGRLFVHGVPVPHGSPHHWLVVHPVFDKTHGVEAALMVHFHRAEVGRHVVLKASRSPNNRGIVRYVAYLRAARPPCPPLRPPSPPSASSSPLCSRSRFLTDGRDGSVCLNEGVLTWSLKVPQVMGRRFDERNFARVAESSKDVGDVRDDKAARGGP